MAPFQGFYENKRVFVTGHTGFKGAWLAVWLKSLGAEVTGYSIEPPSTLNLFEAAGLEQEINHVHGDILDTDTLNKAMAEACPAVVFHLAAQPLVLDSYTKPLETLQTNIIGSANIMEAVRKTDSVTTLVNITTDKCYDNKEQPWGYRENDPLGGHDPYSASKGAMEIICASWNKSFFIPEGRVAAATVRAGNVIGGGDFGDMRLVPDFIRALMDGKPLEIRMPQAVRPWQHVLEPLSGYMWLAAKLTEAPAKFTGGWNFAPGDNACTVEELVETLIRVSDRGEWKDISEKSEMPHEASMLKLCSDKAASMLKWKAILDLEQTMDLTMRGYEPFIDNDQNNMLDTCNKQIAEYTALAAEKGQPWAL